MLDQKQTKTRIAIYKPRGGDIEVEVKLERETMWIDAHQMAKLFGVNRPAVVKHINNIYKTGELNKNSTCSILEQVAADGRIRKMNLYSLDIIIAVGYRINSFRATQFRIWAMLFIYFLEKSDYLYRKNGERKFNDNALITLCLLIAISNPKEKDKMIEITKNLISG